MKSLDKIIKKNCDIMCTLNYIKLEGKYYFH